MDALEEFGMMILQLLLLLFLHDEIVGCRLSHFIGLFHVIIFYERASRGREEDMCVHVCMYALVLKCAHGHA